VKIVQLFLHFAQLVLDFTHLSQDFILLFRWNYFHNSLALNQCIAMASYCFCQPSYPKLRRLVHLTFSKAANGMIADGFHPRRVGWCIALVGRVERKGLISSVMLYGKIFVVISDPIVSGSDPSS
jgi:hypothetical protein